mgnify:FL=1
MCSVMGYRGAGIDIGEFEKAFAKTEKRGPDMSRTAASGDVMLGFHRLAIMGLDESGMQPFCDEYGNMAVCNGELYGFRGLKSALEAKGYRFASGSDCELILPLYREYGLKMFSMLDAEFAALIYDAEKDELIAARDPFGIRPLFYGTTEGGGILFASEAKSLCPLCTQVFPFPPGHYYAGGRFVCYRDISAVKEYSRDGLEDVCANIRRLLTAGIEKRLDSDAPVGFLLSGGLDSSLVCAVAARKSASPIKTFAIGMERDAIDLKYARRVAEYIGSEHTEVFMTDSDVTEVLPEVIYATETYDITTVRASIGMYLVCRYIRANTPVRVLLTGEISDELFGYKYTDFAPNAEEFQKESEKRVRELYAYDVLRADRCISENSLEARVPFGDLAFAEYVLSIDPELKLNRYGKGKYLLRHAFEGDLLPQDILWREKAAFSDAVGHSMADILKRYAEDLYTDEEFEARCRQYTYNTPFTKESLLYRDIFERFFPGRAGLIPGFWMPNRAWKGCDVNDPSARVLANYGASGE